MPDSRFEIVRTDAGWHARFVAANGQTVWTTESYKRKRAATNAVEMLLDQSITESPFADHPEIARGPFRLTTEVRTIDKRTPPREPWPIEPPFYVNTKPRGETFWHDHDYHWRNCYGDECTEGTPPAGTSVRGRIDAVIYSGEAS